MQKPDYEKASEDSRLILASDAQEVDLPNLASAYLAAIEQRDAGDARWVGVTRCCYNCRYDQACGSQMRGGSDAGEGCDEWLPEE